MALTPVVIMIKGDFLYHLIAIDSDQTMGQVAQHANVIGMGRMRLDIEGRALSIRKYQTTDPYPAEMKVSETGLQPMDKLEVYPS